MTSFERRADPLEVRVYHSSLRLGQPLPAAPLFLEPGLHVEVPLEASYTSALGGLPGPDRSRLERGEGA